MQLKNYQIDGVPYTLYSSNGVEMIKVVWINDLLLKILPDYQKYFPMKNNKIEWEQRCEVIEGWIEKNNAHYYISETEDVSVVEVMTAAAKSKKDCVVIETP